MVSDENPNAPTSSEILRRAASLMRERAEAVATWAKRHPEDSGGSLSWFTPVFIENAFAKEAFGPSDDPVLREGWALDGEHFAPWHPAVALAVADWLKSVAVDVDKRDNPQRVGGRYEALRIPDEHAALAVARAYLGESA